MSRLQDELQIMSAELDRCNDARIPALSDELQKLMREVLAKDARNRRRKFGHADIRIADREEPKRG